MDKSKRFDEISIMRVLAMTMIVAFHSMCFYNGRWAKVDAITIPFWLKLSTFLDVIDLNMFVFISGYLYGYLYIYRNKYRHPSEVIWNKIIRLLVPYCFWGVIMVVSFPWNNWSKLLYGVGHLWFLLMLFGVFTLTVILQLLNAQRFKFTLVRGLILIVYGYAFWHILKHYNPKDILCLNRVLYYFPAFMVGYVCAKLRVGWLLPNWSYMCLPLVALLLFVFVWYRIPLPYGLIILIRTLCVYAICIFLLIILSQTIISDRLRTIVHEVEHLSMGLYIFNQISMDLVFTTPVLHQWFEVHWTVGPFLLFLIGFFPPMFMSWVFNRYKILRWTIGG